MKLIMSRTTLKALLVAGAFSSCTMQHSMRGFATEANYKSETNPESAINRVLLEEKAGNPVNRYENVAKWMNDSAKQSAEALPPEARWQSGEIKNGDTWLPVEEIGEVHLSPKVKRYLKLKEETVLNGEGHRKLAGYCEQNKLKEQATSHWYGVLAFDPQNVEARNALGFVNVGDRWVSRDELQMAKEHGLTVQAACKKWSGPIRKWVAAIEGADTKKRLEAIRELKAVEDPGIVHAARFAIPHVETSTATHLVQLIRKFHNRDAAQALATIAIQDLSSIPSQTAIEGLKEYPLESYIPDLLDLMATETTLKENVVTERNGSLVLQLVQEREWRSEKSFEWFDRQLWAPLPQDSRSPGVKTGSKSSRSNADGSRSNTSVSRQTGETDIIVPPNPLVIEATKREANRVIGAVKANADRENTVIRERQKQISAVLRAVTGADLKEDAQEWWAWWDAQQESYLDEVKPVKYGYQRDISNPVYRPERLMATSSSVQESLTPAPQPPSDRPRRRDCLTAGTLISTERGLVPVEKITIGDRVLSQDIETGEIALKPVLRTAIRPPAPTQIVELSTGEKIQSTLGHPWWVIGKGWVKTRDLREGMHLRTTKSAVEIVGIKPAEVVETYNLVVAENNSYFAGVDRVLSFDGNELVHTFQKVPGLPADVRKQKLVSAK